MQPGDIVRILPPFGLSLQGAYRVASVDADGVVFLDGVEGGFDPVYLEKV